MKLESQKGGQGMRVSWGVWATCRCCRVVVLVGASVIEYSLHMWQTFCAQWWMIVQVIFVANNVVLLL